MATFYILLFTIWQQKGKDLKINLVQSGNKKKLTKIQSGNITRWQHFTVCNLQFGNRKEGFTK